MFRDRIFAITLLVSVIAHGVILLQNPNLGLFRTLKTEKLSEVTYIKQIQKQELQEQKSAKMEPFLKLPKKISVDKRVPPPFIEKASVFKGAAEASSRRKITITKPVLADPDIIAIKKKITLPPIGMDKINNATYINYYQLVREKIKRAAYRNYSLDEEGEVYVSFIISSEGTLREVRIMEERTDSSSFLQKVALNSVRDAAPFPAFPKELDYPQLSFNVIISFEIE